MNKLLYFDTCGSMAFVGVLVGETQKTRFFQAGKLGRSDLITEIDSLLREFDLKLTDLDSLVVGTGPGSFTGVRVAVSYAQAFAYALNVQVCTMPSLFFYVPDEDGAFYSILDARRGDVYYAEGVKSGEHLEFKDPKVGALSSLDQERVFVSPDFEDSRAKLNIDVRAPSLSALHLLKGCIRRKGASLPLEIDYLRAPQGAS